MAKLTDSIEEVLQEVQKRAGERTPELLPRLLKRIKSRRLFLPKTVGGLQSRYGIYTWEEGELLDRYAG